MGTTQRCYSHIFVYLLWFILERVQLCSAQFGCDPTIQGPLVLPVRNVSLQSTASRRGAFMTIGTPPQNFAFAVHAKANNSYVFDTDGLCGVNTTALECMARNGGAFDEGSSTSYRNISESTFDQVPDPSPDFDTALDLFGSDTFVFNSSTNLSQMIFDIPRTRGLLRLNILGLGPESRLLTSLKNAGIIASRSFSVFWGQTGIEQAHQMDGNLVLGGYDAAKTLGNNYTAPIIYTPNCRSNLLVTVTDIQMQNQTGDGSYVSIMGSSLGSALQMCIVPDFEVITLPEEQWNNFYLAAGQDVNTGRSYGSNLWGEDFNAPNIYTGSLTFTFSSPPGLTITIPNHQLVQYDISFDASGQTVFDPSVREIMLNSLQAQNSNDMPLLGMTFLQAAYLSVNHDTNSFSLWQANATSEEKLIGIGADGIGCQADAAYNAASSTAPAGPNLTGTNSSSSTTNQSHSTAVIAGVAVSCIAILAAASVFTYIFIRRRRRASAKQASSNTDIDRISTFAKPELPGDNYHDQPHRSEGASYVNEKDGIAVSKLMSYASSRDVSYNSVPQELEAHTYEADNRI